MLELIKQWCYAIRDCSSIFKPLIYYGAAHASATSSMQKINSILDKRHGIFNTTAEETPKIIIPTSLPTLRARHGPAALKQDRISRLGMSRI
ncbi:hypothetical protein F5884DRAFT_764226 [Xylogone sp. PMI_703]|nr:hypothetical protein F5884DRAFT_764226 [Xylogone sp. PMI_703]